MEKQNNVNANLKQPKIERHIFTLDVKFSVIAPPNVDHATLTDTIEKLVDTYLRKNYDVSNITIPGRPGLPSGTIVELTNRR